MTIYATIITVGAVALAALATYLFIVNSRLRGDNETDELKGYLTESLIDLLNKRVQQLRDELAEEYELRCQAESLLATHTEPVDPDAAVYSDLAAKYGIQPGLTEEQKIETEKEHAAQRLTEYLEHVFPGAGIVVSPEQVTFTESGAVIVTGEAMVDTSTMTFDGEVVDPVPEDN